MTQSGKGALWKTGRRLFHRMKLEAHRFNWHRSNRHNETSAVNQFQRNHVHVGNYSYGPLRVIDGAAPSVLRIGSYCSIAEDVTFVLNGDHPLDRLSTFPFRAFVLGEEEVAQSRGDIVLEDDVWIGYGAVILSGVTLGRGSVVAAGAVVTRDVPDYAVVVGSPARKVRSRLAPNVVGAARRVKLSLLDERFLRQNIELIDETLDGRVAEDIEKALERYGDAAS